MRAGERPPPEPMTDDRPTTISNGHNVELPPNHSPRPDDSRIREANGVHIELGNMKNRSNTTLEPTTDDVPTVIANDHGSEILTDHTSRTEVKELYTEPHNIMTSCVNCLTNGGNASATMYDNEQYATINA